MAVLVKNVCIADSASVLAAIKANYPNFFYSSNNQPVGVYLSASSINMNTGVLTYSTKNDQGQTLNQNSSVTYPLCADADANLTQSLPDVVFVCTFVIVWALGFLVGSHR